MHSYHCRSIIIRSAPQNSFLDRICRVATECSRLFLPLSHPPNYTKFCFYTIYMKQNAIMLNKLGGIVLSSIRSDTQRSIICVIEKKGINPCVGIDAFAPFNAFLYQYSPTFEKSRLIPGIPGTQPAGTPWPVASPY